MIAVYRFLSTYEGLIYILLALGGLFSFRWLWKSWREWRESIFGLEREFALRRFSQSLTISLVLILLFVIEVFFASFIAPTLPASEFLATSTLDQSEMLGGAEGAPSDENQPVPTNVSVGITPSEAEASGCVPNEIILTSPVSGQEVAGTVTLVGTVNIDDFGFYKYEVSPSGTDVWTTISAGREIVKNNDIGLWDTSTLTPGDYQLRLIATDNEGASFPPCVVPVRVVSDSP